MVIGIEGVVLPIATDRRDVDRQKSAAVSTLCFEFGATRTVECRGDDLDRGESGDGDSAVFARTESPGRATSDARHARVRAGRRTDPLLSMART